MVSDVPFKFNLHRYREVHRKVAHLANRFHGRGWLLRGSTRTVRRNDQAGGGGGSSTRPRVHVSLDYSFVRLTSTQGIIARLLR